MFPALVFEGACVRLEPLALRHLPGLSAAASGPRDTYALTWVPEGEPAMLRYVEEALALRESGAAMPFATIQRATGRAIGSTRFFTRRSRPTRSRSAGPGWRPTRSARR